jgi:hypothetical protein
MGAALGSSPTPTPAGLPADFIVLPPIEDSSLFSAAKSETEMSIAAHFKL